MKRSLFVRSAVVLLVGILAFGPMLAFAAPMMDSPGDMTATSGAKAQSACADCPDFGSPPGSTVTFCGAGCLAPAMLPDVAPMPEPVAGHVWRTITSPDPPGFASRIEPYPPDLSA